MRLLLSYLKRHTTLLVAVVLTTCIFCTVLYLYQLPWEPALYAGLLTLVMLLVLGVLRYIAYYRRHRQLQQVLAQIDVELGELPEPSDAIEAEYRQLLEALEASKQTLISNSDRLRKEQLDYYTLWAHQIKTPIAAMDMLLQSESADREALKDQLFYIEKYTEMVLQYLRLESFSGDLTVRRVQLDDLIRAAVRQYARFFIQKKIRLKFTPTDYTVLTDPKWLSFVLEQLLSNAVKYTPGGTVTIKMPEPGILLLQDTGIGIREEDVPRIFERGFTGFNGRLDRKSTGIGLYLVQTVMTRLGHGITAASSPGKGTTMTLDLRKKETDKE